MGWGGNGKPSRPCREHARGCPQKAGSILRKPSLYSRPACATHVGVACVRFGPHRVRHARGRVRVLYWRSKRCPPVSVVGVPHTHAHIHRRGPLGRVTSPPAMELSYATTMHYRDVVFYVTTDRNRAYFVCGGVFIPWGGRVPRSPGRLPSLVWSFEGQAQTTAWSPTMYEASSDNAACRTCVPLGRTRCFWTACVF